MAKAGICRVFVAWINWRTDEAGSLPQERARDRNWRSAVQIEYEHSLACSLIIAPLVGQTTIRVTIITVSGEHFFR